MVSGFDGDRRGRRVWRKGSVYQGSHWDTAWRARCGYMHLGTYLPHLNANTTVKVVSSLDCLTDVTSKLQMGVFFASFFAS